MSEQIASSTNTTVADPISNQERVLVRQTATGVEQVIAAGAGLITAGPLGAAASWAVLRGVQGKWAPWSVAGFVCAPILLILQFAVIGAANSAEMPLPEGDTVEIISTDYSVPAANAHVDFVAAFDR